MSYIKLSHQGNVNSIFIDVSSAILKSLGYHIEKNSIPHIL